MKLIGVAWPQWEWHVLSECGMSAAGVECCQLVERIFSGCNICSLGVSMASVGVTWPR